MTGCGKESFEQAQGAELGHWARHTDEDDYIRYELVEHSEVARPLRGLCGERVFGAGLGVGVGPYCLGFLGVHLRDRVRQIDAVDPLPRLELRVADSALRAEVDEIRGRVNYIRARGESIPVRSEAYGIVACVNVVDHAENPSQILAEMYRVLKPGGLFVFGVNTLSVAGELKWRLARAVRPREWFFVAHPHMFTWRRAERALRNAVRGSRMLWSNKSTRWRRVVGHRRMSFWIVAKGARAWS